MGEFHRSKCGKNKLIIIATDDEIKLVQNKSNIIKTGVGGLNVIESLKDINRNTKILNIGYAGSNSIPIGTRVKIGQCKLYHPNVEYKEPTYKLDGDIACYTSNDFVLNTDIEEPCVFDMELAYILALGFKNVESIKIVSDNLSKKEYEKNI